MPLSAYNRLYGGKPGSAAEAHSAMVSRYGQKKGDSVFYALVNKRRSALSRKRRRNRRKVRSR